MSGAKWGRERGEDDWWNDAIRGGRQGRVLTGHREAARGQSGRGEALINPETKPRTEAAPRSGLKNKSKNHNKYTYK